MGFPPGVETGARVWRARGAFVGDAAGAWLGAPHSAEAARRAMLASSEEIHVLEPVASTVVVTVVIVIASTSPSRVIGALAA